MTTNAAWLEVGWTAMSFIALVALLGALGYAVGNHRWARQTYPRDATMHRLARSFVQILGALTVIPLLFFVVGLLAMDTPPNPAAAASVTSVVSAVAFMVSNGLLVTVALGLLVFIRSMRETD